MSAKNSRAGNSGNSDNAATAPGQSGVFDFKINLGSKLNTYSVTAPGNYHISGGSGNDTITGGAGNDWLVGGAGADILYGGMGNDRLMGDSGNDKLYGGQGDDYLMGDSGSDWLVGGAGNDNLDGGSDFDTACYSGSVKDYLITITGNSLNDPAGRGKDDTFWKGAIITDLRDGSPDGTDTLRHIERICFEADGREIFLDGRNNAPFAFDDQITTTAGAPVSVAASTLLANDFDFDGGTLSVVSVNGATNGTVAYDANTGQITFTPSGNLDGSFTYKVSDGQGGFAVATVTVTVGGTPGNRPAVIGNPSASVVTEDVLVNQLGYLTASGTISISDPDPGQNSFQTMVISAETNLGSLSLGADGSYKYSVKNADVQHLVSTTSHDDTFTLTSVDGTTKQVSFTISGADDPAVIGTPPIAEVYEDRDVVDGYLIATGTITITDPDQGESKLGSVTPLGSPLGSLTLEPTAIEGTYTYTYKVLNSLSAVQNLDDGQTSDQKFTITSVDGTSRTLTFTIYGANEQITGVNTARLTEDSGLTDGKLVATGDLDGGVFVVDSGASTLGGSTTAVGNGYGSYQVSADGNWTYVVDNSSPQVQSLPQDGTLVEYFSVRTEDGLQKVVTVTIFGVNDAPVVSGPVTRTATEGTGTVTLNALANASDVDTGDILRVVNVPQSLPAGLTYANNQFTLDTNDPAYAQLGQGQVTIVGVSFGVSDDIATTPASVEFTVNHV